MWQVIYTKDGVVKVHNFAPSTREQALSIGHELTRDFVADFFKVQKKG